MPRFDETVIGDANRAKVEVDKPRCPRIAQVSCAGIVGNHDRRADAQRIDYIEAETFGSVQRHETIARCEQGSLCGRIEGLFNEQDAVVNVAQIANPAPVIALRVGKQSAQVVRLHYQGDVVSCEGCTKRLDHRKRVFTLDPGQGV